MRNKLFLFLAMTNKKLVKKQNNDWYKTNFKQRGWIALFEGLTRAGVYWLS